MIRIDTRIASTISIAHRPESVAPGRVRDSQPPFRAPDNEPRRINSDRPSDSAAGRAYADFVGGAHVRNVYEGEYYARHQAGPDRHHVPWAVREFMTVAAHGEAELLARGGRLDVTA